MPAEASVKISKEEYEELLDARDKLDALERAGVDNWDGWDDAMNIYEELQKERKSEG